MKIKQSLKAPMLFVSFCLLISSRDIFSDFLLNEEVDPLFMLVVFALTASICAWMVRAIRTKSINPVRPFKELENSQKLLSVKQGLSTSIVYIITILGIKYLGAQVFNIVDYGGMPIITLLLASSMLAQKIDRAQIIGAIIGLSGLTLFYFFPSENLSIDRNGWVIWIAISLLSPFFTSLCSVFQAKQLKNGMHPDEVLMYRFPITALLAFSWLLVEQPAIHWQMVPGLVFLGVTTVFLPLWLLSYGIMLDSLRRFSVYLFLIPIFTFLLGPLLVEKRWTMMLEPAIVGGAILIAFGFLVFEKVVRISPKQ
jgi:drug/metabolite transporter (DMT)-like permease